jgi:hypothetical protein
MSYPGRNQGEKYVSDSVQNGAHILNKYYLAYAARIHAEHTEHEGRLPHWHYSYQINAEY